jgi:hypothetical protein
MSRECQAAKHILDICNEIEINYFKSGKLNESNLADCMISYQPNDSFNYNNFNKLSTNSINSVITSPTNQLVKTYLNTIHNDMGNFRYLWIKLAILNKSLTEIVEYLYNNSAKYYFPHGLIADSLDGELFCSLLIGPCTLEYTRIKSTPQSISDPNAEELLQRHKIQSLLNHVNSSTAVYMPNGVNSIAPHTPPKKKADSAKEYVESLHQNYKSQLIYGKNNICVKMQQNKEEIIGYLSLHQSESHQSLTLKWTPNQLLNSSSSSNSSHLKSYSKDSIQIEIYQIAYLHCHQERIGDSSSSVTLVAKDGVQSPPIFFANNSQLRQFLACLELGLNGNFKLDDVSENSKWEEVMELGANFSIVLKVNPCNNEEHELEQQRDMAMQDQMYRAASSYFELSPIGNAEQSNAKLPTNNNKLDLNLFETNTCTNRGDLRNLCNTMKNKIISRAFNGWLEHYRYTKNIKKNLLNLVATDKPTPSAASSLDSEMIFYIQTCKKLDEALWSTILSYCQRNGSANFNLTYLQQIIYENGVETTHLRKIVWPFLLEHYSFDMTQEECDLKYMKSRDDYQKIVNEWKQVEEFIRHRNESSQNESSSSTPNSIGSKNDSGIYSDHSLLSAMSPKTPISSSMSSSSFSSSLSSTTTWTTVNQQQTKFNQMLGEISEKNNTNNKTFQRFKSLFSRKPKLVEIESEELVVEAPKVDETFMVKELSQLLVANAILKATHKLSEENDSLSDIDEINQSQSQHAVRSSAIDTPRFIQDANDNNTYTKKFNKRRMQPNVARKKKNLKDMYSILNNSKNNSNSASSNITTPSPADFCSNKELLDSFSLNMHRIDKDVARCDRNHWYFTNNNLKKLENIMYTYVWKNMQLGYQQGMCDCIAPLLIVLDDEALAYSCYVQLMSKQMSLNFAASAEMDKNFFNMSSLIQILDSQLYEHLKKSMDYDQFYFCYRWFLLDFKREFVHDDVQNVWETIWSAKGSQTTQHFCLFLATALIETYRDIIIDNNMEFTDITKFFNEMAEKHDTEQVLKLARSLVSKLQEVIKTINE